MKISLNKFNASSDYKQEKNMLLFVKKVKVSFTFHKKLDFTNITKFSYSNSEQEI